MNIAVYCSARTNIAPECFNDARMLGQWIGRHGHTLVYGGLKMGLMDAIASATASAGGKIIGVVPDTRVDLQHPDNTVNIPVCSLHERKAIMEENADIFVALDGGYGTLDEVISALASMSFFNSVKPILLLNRDDLFTPLPKMFNEMVHRGLMYADVAQRLSLCSDIDTLIFELEKNTK